MRLAAQSNDQPFRRSVLGNTARQAPGSHACAGQSQADASFPSRQIAEPSGELLTARPKKRTERSRTRERKKKIAAKQDRRVDEICREKDNFPAHHPKDEGFADPTTSTPWRRQAGGGTIAQKQMSSGDRPASSTCPFLLLPTTNHNHSRT